MKKMIMLALAFLITAAPFQQSKASDITTSVVVGVLVTQYAGTLAGVAASSLLAGTAVVIHSAGKEAAVKAAQNDIQNFYSSGELSLALENTVKSIQALDESISEEEAMDMILEAVNA